MSQELTLSSAFSNSGGVIDTGSGTQIVLDYATLLQTNAGFSKLVTDSLSERF